MQYLKDSVRNKIVEEALKEFKIKGYKGSSIRNIVKNSNTSIGNFYKYFEGKDILYESLIGSVYHKMMDYINQFSEVKIDEKTENIFHEFLERIMGVFKESSTELMILLNKSEGSQYENCKGIFVEFITRIVSKKMNYELHLQEKELGDNFIIYLTSYNLVESISIILREKEDGIEVRKLILDIIDILYSDLLSKLDCKDITISKEYT